MEMRGCDAQSVVIMTLTPVQMCLQLPASAGRVFFMPIRG